MKIRSDISMGNLSDVGRERTQNEDYFGYWEADEDDVFQRKGRLIIVADGMGGHVGGYAASRLAVEAVKSHYQSDASTTNIQDSLKKAIEQANASIFERAKREPELEGMGTTCTSMVIHSGLAYIAHVGDSRIYQIRNGQIQQLTFDHSWVQQMVRDGHLTPEEAVNHPKSNVVLRSVGTKPSVDVEVYNPIPVAKGDTYLLCSDGLTGLVSDMEICRIAANNKPQSACQELVNLANQRGGHDNITVQVLRIDSLDGRPPAAASVPRETRPIASPKPEKPALSPKTEITPLDPSSSLLKIVIPVLLLLLIAGGYFGIKTFNQKVQKAPETPPIEEKTETVEPELPTPQPVSEPTPQPAGQQKISERKVIFKPIGFKNTADKDIPITEETPLFITDEKIIDTEKGIKKVFFYIGHERQEILYATESESFYIVRFKDMFQDTKISLSKDEIKNFHSFYNDRNNNLYFAFKEGEENIVIKKANQKDKTLSEPIIIFGKTAESIKNKTAYVNTPAPIDFSFFPINEKIFLVNVNSEERTRLIDFDKKSIDPLGDSYPISESLASNVWLPSQISFFSKKNGETIFYDYLYENPLASS